MKKYLALLLSLAFAVCLSACDRLPGSVGDLLDSTGDPAGSANTDSGVGYPEDGYASGYMGDTMHTAFFDFTVDSAYTTQEFDGLTAAGEGMSYLTEYYDRPAPADGCKFLVVEITLHNDVLKIDGNFAIAWSGSLEFTVERSGKSLIGSAASGEGLVNVYRGTGKVLMMPTGSMPNI